MILTNCHDAASMVLDRKWRQDAGFWNKTNGLVRCTSSVKQTPFYKT